MSLAKCEMEKDTMGSSLVAFLTKDIKWFFDKLQTYPVDGGCSYEQMTSMDPW